MGRDIAVQVGGGRMGSGEEGEGFHAWSEKGDLVRWTGQERDKVGVGKEKLGVKVELENISEKASREVFPREFVHGVSIFVPWPAFPASEGMSVLSIVVRDTSTLRVSPCKENQLYQEIGDILNLILILILILIFVQIDIPPGEGG